MIEQRVEQLEKDMSEMKGILNQLQPMIVRMDERVLNILPTLATKTELARLASDEALNSVRVEVAELRGTLGRLPGRPFFITTAIAVLTLIFAVLGFGPTVGLWVQSLVGVQ